jgi:tRNA (guanine37-N1)-methyltransferase
MLFAKVELGRAQAALQFLRKKELVANSFRIEKDRKFLYIPLAGEPDRKILPSGSVIVKRKGREREIRQGYRELLDSALTEKEKELVGKAYDIIGSVIVIEIPHELKKKEAIIAKALLRVHPGVKTVAKKVGGHTGKLRIQKLQILAGKKSLITLFKENGILLKMDVSRVYFSPRSATERSRVASLVKPNEKVLVMFSGIAPFPLVISKNSSASEIVGVELNKAAHKYALENVMLNKVSNVELLCGDARKIVPSLKTKFDRIVMPLPKTGEDFLDIALAAAKPGAMIHFYSFEKEQDLPDITEKKVLALCSKQGKKVRVVGIVKCGQPSPRMFRVCTDFIVN